jgi:hypothetical protein
MAEWIEAIGSLLSALAALFSVLAFLSALKTQREDSINGVRPEWYLQVARQAPVKYQQVGYTGAGVATQTQRIAQIVTQLGQ